MFVFIFLRFYGFFVRICTLVVTLYRKYLLIADVEDVNYMINNGDLVRYEEYSHQSFHRTFGKFIILFIVCTSPAKN